MYYPVLNQRQLYYRRPGATDSAYVWQQISQASDSTLYVKREGSAFYLIPAYTATGEGQEIPFRNIRFRLLENDKKNKTSIVVETFESPYIGPYSIQEKQTKKACRKMLEKMFSEK